MEPNPNFASSSINSSVKTHKTRDILFAVLLTIVIISGLAVGVYFEFFKGKEANNNSVETCKANISSFSVAKSSQITPKSMSTDYAKLFTGISKYLSTDGSLNAEVIKKDANWEDLKNIVIYSLYGFTRVQNTAFQTEGTLDSESALLTISRIDTANKVEKNDVFTSTVEAGGTYLFDSESYSTTPKNIQTIIDYLNRALNGELGTPQCDNLKENEACEFSKKEVVTVDENNPETIEIKFTLTGTKSLSSSSFSLVSKAFADMSWGDYEVVATIYSNGLISDLSFNMISSDTDGVNTPWYSATKFVYGD